MKFLVGEEKVLIVEHLLGLCWNFRSSFSCFFWRFAGNGSVNPGVQIVLTHVGIVEATDRLDEIADGKARVAVVRCWWHKVSSSSNIGWHVALIIRCAVGVHPGESTVDILEVFRLNFVENLFRKYSMKYLFVLNMISFVIVTVKDLRFEIFKSVVDQVPGNDIFFQIDDFESSSESFMDDRVFVCFEDESHVPSSAKDWFRD